MCYKLIVYQHDIGFTQELYMQAVSLCCLCNILVLVYLPIFFRVTSPALGQSYDCPSAREATLKDMGKIDHNNPLKIDNLITTIHNKAYQKWCAYFMGYMLSTDHTVLCKLWVEDSLNI